MLRLIALTLVLFASLASATMPYVFSHRAEDFLSSPLDESFDCEGRIYGYYADMANNCEVFHVCVPIQDVEDGEIHMAHYSFICGNGTQFSQDALTCMHHEDAMDCQESQSYYDLVNSEFGVIRERDSDELAARARPVRPRLLDTDEDFRDDFDDNFDDDEDDFS